MHQPAATVRNHPATRTALFMALAGIGLLSYVVSAWLDVGAQPIITAYDAGSTDHAGAWSSGAAPAAAMAAGFVLLLAACVVLLQSLRDRASAALRDPVTGLYTSLYAAEVLPGLAARDDRDGRSRLVLVRVEIEAIEEMRCRYGGEAVELVMASVGRHIRTQTREDDLPVEPGVEGFSIYLHCEDIDQARAFCRRLATLLRAEQLDWNGDVIKVSAAMRITVRRLAESIEVLQQRASSGFEPSQARQVSRFGA